MADQTLEGKTTTPDPAKTKQPDAPVTVWVKNKETGMCWETSPGEGARQVRSGDFEYADAPGTAPGPAPVGASDTSK